MIKLTISLLKPLSPILNLDSSKIVLLFISFCSTVNFYTMNAYDNRQLFILIFVRLCFDTVSHAKLLSKLWDAGIIGNLWSFFKAYLSNRQQCVVVANNKSNWYAVTSGVPQGSMGAPYYLSFLLMTCP